jgi:hypothetical protein
LALPAALSRHHSAQRQHQRDNRQFVSHNASKLLTSGRIPSSRITGRSGIPL